MKTIFQYLKHSFTRSPISRPSISRLSRHSVLQLLSLMAAPALLPADASAPSTTASNDEPISLSKVVVTGTVDAYTVPNVGVGSKQAVSLRETPNSISVITQQRIQDQNLTTVADALNQVTGVTVIANDTTQSQYRARGYSLGELNDGIPSYNGLSGYQQFDLIIYDRVEVLRGPAGLFQGTGDPAGVVNFIRKRPGETFDASMTSSVGSWNNYRTSVDVSTPLNSNRTVRARIVGSGQDRDYFYDFTHDRKWVGYATVDWNATPTTLVSVWGAIQTDRTTVPYSGLPAWSSGGLLAIDRSTNPYPYWTIYRWKTKDYGIDLEQKFGENWSVRLRPTRRDQSFYFKDSYPTDGVDPVTQTLPYARRVRDYNYQRDAVDVYLAGSFPFLERPQHLTLGYNYDSLWTDYSGVTAPVAPNVPFGRTDLVNTFDLPYNLGGESKTTQSGYYGQLRLQLLEPLSLIGGGRISKYDTKSRNVPPATQTAWSWGAKARHEFTPYAGIVYDFTKHLSLYGSYSDIFIPLSQLKYTGGPLDPRRGKQFETGFKGEFFDKKLNASIAYFDLKDKNRAYADPDHTNFYLNRGEVDDKGWETEVSGSPYAGLELQAGYTRLDTVYVRDVSNIGLSVDTWEPRHTFRSWVKYSFDHGSLRGLRFGFGANYASRSIAGNGASAIRHQGGYTVINTLVGYSFNARLSANLNLNNLLDKTYYTRLGGTNTYNTYGEPRNFALSLRYNFK